MKPKPPLKKSIFSPRNDIFLKQLRAARQAAGLSQRQAAKLLGRPQSFVSKSESSERRVDVIELLDFLRAYKADFKEFVIELEEVLRNFQG